MIVIDSLWKLILVPVVFYLIISRIIRFSIKFFPFCRFGFHYGKPIHKDYGNKSITYFNCHYCGEITSEWREDSDGLL